ncbi:MAG: PaaI family thioesterase [Alphaproteobacteria bacterium]
MTTPAHSGKPANQTTMPDNPPPNIESTFERNSPASDLLGQKIIGCDVDQGVVDVEYHATDPLCNKWGGIHGGMVAAMLDDIMALAAGLKVEWGQIVPTLEMKVNYITPARPGTLTAQARVVRRGKSVIFLEAELWNAEGKLAATGTSTYTVVTLKKKEKK